MSDLSGFYDREGEPIPLVMWSGLFGDWEYRRVDETYVGNRYRVVTIWVGHEVGPGLGDPPHIFESTVFGLDGAPVRVRQYATEAQARAGHEELLIQVRSTL